jgi:Tetracyclin repressor-like, C-terminal domain
MLSRSAEAIPTPDSGSVRDDLLAVVRAVITYLTSPTGLAVLHVISLTVDDYRDARQSFWAARLDALRPVVERGIARGELRPDTDARLLLETLVAPLHGRLLLTGEPVDATLAERIVDLVLDGALRRQRPGSWPV